MTEKIQLLNKDINELAQLLTGKLGQKAFRAQQLFNWIYDKKVNSFKQMQNLPGELVDILEKKTEFSPLEILCRQQSADGTEKFLFRLEDDSRIETVFLPWTDGRRSICISTQVGCLMGCSFCATGKMGLIRNLNSAEMVNQILTVEKIKKQGISNAVFMGMGEPLANYSPLLKAIDIINDNSGLNIGMRKITVSTCGLVPEIYKLADEKLQLTLAVSLNAATDKVRDIIMPINKKHPVQELMKACRHYATETGRRVTFEYVLMKEINDSPQQAQKLAELLGGTLSHVNLIPVNPVTGFDCCKSTRKALEMFKLKLESRNVPVSVRKERGRDIDAACGQLKGE